MGPVKAPGCYLTWMILLASKNMHFRDPPFFFYSRGSHQERGEDQEISTLSFDLRKGGGSVDGILGKGRE